MKTRIPGLSPPPRPSTSKLGELAHVLRAGVFGGGEHVRSRTTSPLTSLTAPLLFGCPRVRKGTSDFTSDSAGEDTSDSAGEDTSDSAGEDTSDDGGVPSGRRAREAASDDDGKAASDGERRPTPGPRQVGFFFFFF